jgi:predicted nucleic acid-binding protein
MGLKYLWDTNTVIYYLQKNFSDEVQASLNIVINTYKPAISVITEIELQCWKAATSNDLVILKSFVADCVVFELDTALKSKIIDVRKTYNIKLPDSIIAATALLNELTLITNDNEFNKVMELSTISPFELE